jgi:hypothetical protein
MRKRVEVTREDGRRASNDRLLFMPIKGRVSNKWRQANRKLNGVTETKSIASGRRDNQTKIKICNMMDSFSYARYVTNPNADTSVQDATSR